MGLYATVSGATVRCPTCGEPLASTWQFQFGAVSDLPSYGIGDAIRWGGARWFGQPAMSLVYAVAYPGQHPACVRCGADDVIAEVVIRDGVIEELANPRAAAWLSEVLYEGEGREPRYHDDLYCVPSGQPIR